MKILIVEDELLIARDLADMLEDFGHEVIGIAKNYTIAVQLFDEERPDLALLDINLGGYKTGIDVAAYISETRPVPFIYLSSYEDMPTVNAALKTAPTAYLQKPFQKTALYSALELAVQNFKQKTQTNTEPTTSGAIIDDALFIRDKDSLTKISLADILYLKSDRNYLELHTAARKYLIRQSLKEMQHELPAWFIQIHKSYLVNTKLITVIHSGTVSIGDVELPLSSSYKDNLLGIIKSYS